MYSLFLSKCKVVHIYSPKKAKFSQISSKLSGVNISEHLKMIWKQRCKHDRTALLPFFRLALPPASAIATSPPHIFRSDRANPMGIQDPDSAVG
jgi:hypothetical protein